MEAPSLPKDICLDLILLTLSTFNLNTRSFINTRLQVSEYLLDLGCVVLERVDDLTGMTCLAASAASGHKQLVQLFLKHGAR